MSDERFEDFVQAAEPEKPARPTVVLVFGILSIVGCSLMILFTIPTFGFTMIIPVACILLSMLMQVLKIVGVAQMFGMRKMGFYLYTFGELASYLVGLWQSKYNEELTDYMIEMYEQQGMSQAQLDQIQSMTDLGNQWMVPLMIISLALSALWIGVYASHLKSMK
jgi:hypothetical protein